MRTLLIPFLLGVSLMAQPALSELELLRAEVHRLKVALAQAQATIADREMRLNQIQLTQDRATLEAQFRQTLACPADAGFDWSTLQCEVKK